uniref:Mce/MlaD domain-containing protein n=1 Tax=Magnetococcus massalia (strain MO-1) TaxID=451514 RepID=A0A1S7LMB7_MAGMO|nr:conserved protein of unknown function [Include MCE domain] [Candidatus Magnetococcus massalia]
MVGLFVLAGIAAMAWLSIKLARMEIVGGDHRPIYAHFASVSGLKEGASIEMAGVQIGRVESIRLDQDEFDARVKLLIRNDIPIQEDAIASIRTQGLIGDRFIKLSPGASDLLLNPGERMLETEPAISIEELISQFIHGSVK